MMFAGGWTTGGFTALMLLTNRGGPDPIKNLALGDIWNGLAVTDDTRLTVTVEAVDSVIGVCPMFDADVIFVVPDIVVEELEAPDLELDMPIDWFMGVSTELTIGVGLIIDSMTGITEVMDIKWRCSSVSTENVCFRAVLRAVVRRPSCS
jgi:hypothetical protein